MYRVRQAFLFPFLISLLFQKVAALLRQPANLALQFLTLLGLLHDKCLRRGRRHGLERLGKFLGADLVEVDPSAGDIVNQFVVAEQVGLATVRTVEYRTTGARCGRGGIVQLARRSQFCLLLRARLAITVIQARGIEADWTAESLAAHTQAVLQGGYEWEQQVIDEHLTGHVVLSTLHTNDSASAITRLVDMGVEPFLISSSVLAVAAQRLIRVLCDDCKKPYKPSKIYLESIGVSPNHFNADHIYKAVGCDKCIGTGYRGRLGIFEIMRLTEKLKSLILGTYDANQIKNEARREKMLSLRQDGIQKVLNGVTTIEEVLRVTQK